jgi:hypothetical protein
VSQAKRDEYFPNLVFLGVPLRKPLCSSAVMKDLKPFTAEANTEVLAEFAEKHSDIST